jgi:WD40 repeat protein
MPFTRVLKPDVVSVCIQGSMVVVGTRSSDILLVELPTTKGENLALRRLVWAHQVGCVGAVAPHPFKQEFATGGADHTARIWSSRASQMAFRRLPDACTALAYHPRGSTLVVGLQNGAVSLLDAQSAQLRTLCSWQHSNDVRPRA